MTKRLLLFGAVALLALPASATAGGWATVSLDSVPGGSKSWDVELTILQHGVTPLEGVRPRVIVISQDGDRQAFAARPMGKPGVYAASVTFPGPGKWRYAIDDGFSATHSYPPVRIGKGGGLDVRPVASSVAPSGGGDGFNVTLALIAAALAGTAAWLGMRVRRG